MTSEFPAEPPGEQNPPEEQAADPPSARELHLLVYGDDPDPTPHLADILQELDLSSNVGDPEDLARRDAVKHIVDLLSRMGDKGVDIQDMYRILVEEGFAWHRVGDALDWGKVENIFRIEGGRTIYMVTPKDQQP